MFMAYYCETDILKSHVNSIWDHGWSYYLTFTGEWQVIKLFIKSECSSNSNTHLLYIPDKLFVFCGGTSPLQSLLYGVPIFLFFNQMCQNVDRCPGYWLALWCWIQMWLLLHHINVDSENEGLVILRSGTQEIYSNITV